MSILTYFIIILTFYLIWLSMPISNLCQTFDFFCHSYFYVRIVWMIFAFIIVMFSWQLCFFGSFDFIITSYHFKFCHKYEFNLIILSFYNILSHSYDLVCHNFTFYVKLSTLFMSKKKKYVRIICIIFHAFDGIIEWQYFITQCWIVIIITYLIISNFCDNYDCYHIILTIYGIVWTFYIIVIT